VLLSSIEPEAPSCPRPIPVRVASSHSIKSSDVLNDLEPFELLRALIGALQSQKGPAWQRSSKPLADIRITRSRPVREGPERSCV